MLESYKLMFTKIISWEQPNALAQALRNLNEGGLVAFPTDTVYGLGALALQPRSIEQLYRVKSREATKAIPILLSSPDELDQVAVKISPQARRLAERFWPGPLTI